ncbi:MAG: type II toxin-antitoxin system ParD family antitoxin [Bdellovibrionales bacterium]
MLSTRINARLSGPLAEFINHMTGKDGLYETPSEYIRDLIRRDMKEQENFLVQESIMAGYRDLEKEMVIKSTGDFKKDLEILAKKEVNEWL